MVAKHGLGCVGVLIIATASLLFAAGTAAGATSLTQVTGASPFGGCAIGGPGTNYPNAEVEPFVAVNPANPADVVGGFQQDRWNNGGAHGLVNAFSPDGGQTWGESWAAFSQCEGGTWDRASDPWVSSGPDGTV